VTKSCISYSAQFKYKIHETTDERRRVRHQSRKKLINLKKNYIQSVEKATFLSDYFTALLKDTLCIIIIIIVPNPNYLDENKIYDNVQQPIKLFNM